MENTVMMNKVQWGNDGIVKEAVYDLTFSESYDVVVLGAGTAGAIAAIKLSELGHNVLVIEKQNFIGGIYASTMFHYYKGSPGGFYELLDREIDDAQKGYNISLAMGSNPLLRRVIAMRKLQRKAKVYCDAVIMSVYRDENSICGIEVLNNRKAINIAATYFVDATAEASLVKIAGMEVHKGRAFDQLSQPFSNVRLFYDFEKNWIEFNNIDAGSIDQDDPFNYAKMAIASLNNSIYSNEQKNQITLGMSPIIGIREGNTIQGIKRLTLKQIVDGYVAKEPLFYTSANFDNHTKEMAFESEQLCDWVVGMSMWSTLVSIPIEKEVMLPREVGNVIAVGRIMSLDHDVSSHTRMMRDCQKSGEAGALIVDTSIKHNVSLATVNYESLRPLLMENGCLLEENNYGLQDNPPIGDYLQMTIPRDDDALQEALMSERPGFAMLHAYREKKTERLITYLMSENENLQSNAALVLAILDCNDGIEVLEKLAKRRDTTLPKTSKSYNVLRGVSAVYCLGRLHEKRSAGLLLQMLADNENFINDNIELNKFIGSKEDYRFQYVSHLVRALVNIAVHNDDIRHDILLNVSAIIENSDFKVFTSLKSNQCDLHEMTSKLRDYFKWKTEEKI